MLGGGWQWIKLPEVKRQEGVPSIRVLRYIHKFTYIHSYHWLHAIVSRLLAKITEIEETLLKQAFEM